MKLTDKVASFPVWLWLAGTFGVAWYLSARRQGLVERGTRSLLLEAFDEPQERAELLRGVVIGLVAGIVTYYLLTKRTLGGRSR